MLFITYRPEQKAVLGLGQVRQHRDPDACTHMELVETVDTITHVTVRSKHITR